MKKKYIIFLFVMVLGLTGCGKKSQNEVNVLNWSSYIPDSVISDFTKETGIKVNYGTYSSNEECLAKVTSSKEGTFDVIFPSDYMVSLLIQKDYLQILNKSKLSNYKNLKTNYLNLEYDPNNTYSLPFLAASVIIVKNSENIKDKIESYNDLLNPKYKNDIVLVDDQRIIIGIALLALGYDMNEVDETKLKEAEQWLLKLKANVKGYDSDSPKMFLISKEVNLGVIWNAEAAIAIEDNPNIEVIYPKEGFVLSIDNYVILKGAKNTENAYKFINYLLREDVMAKIIESYPYKNLNESTDRLLSNDYLNNKAANFPDYLLNDAYFVKNIGDKVKAYDKIWADIK